MTRRLGTALLSFVTLVLALAVPSLLALSALQRSETRLAYSLLGAGQDETAQVMFRRLGQRPLGRERAIDGLVLTQRLARCDTAQHVDAAATGLLPAEAQASLGPLLERTVRAGCFRTTLDLVRLGDESAQVGFARYRRMARLELDLDIDEDRDLGRAFDSTYSGGLPFDRRLEEVALRIREGHTPMVFDRRGRMLGSLDHAGQWHPTEIAEGLDVELWLEQAGELPKSDGIRLSLDVEWTRRARRALGRERGSIVILDARTGEVVVAISDERTMEREGAAVVLEQRREPASIAKLITSSAVLRAGLDIDREISSQVCRGSVEVEDGHLYCPVVSGRNRSLAQALARSCNSTFAELGLGLGRERMVAEYERYGFGQLGARTHDAWQGSLLAPIDRRRELAELSVGLNFVEITPMHAAVMAATFAEGLLFQPRWVSATDGVTGRSPRVLGRPDAKRIHDPDWLPELQQAMGAVASYGTVAGVAPKTFPVAMKTGTASEAANGFHVNYIGIAPWPDPRYSFSLRLTHHRTSKRVRRAAYNATYRLLDALSEVADEPVPEREAWSTVVTAGGG